MAQHAETHANATTDCSNVSSIRNKRNTCAVPVLRSLVGAYERVIDITKTPIIGL